METGYEMAYFIIGISILALIGGFFIDKIDFKKSNTKHQH